ncbi:MAG: iron-sulfur cluster assembly protein [Spirochaetales bacterium]
MDPEIQDKIDVALSRVKEPQSDVPIVDLGLVGNVRYSAEQSTIEVTLAIGYPPGQCPACLAINGVVKQGIMRRTTEEFQKEFPGFAIIVL